MIPKYLINTLPEVVKLTGLQESREVHISYTDPDGNAFEDWLSPRLSLRIDNHSPDGFNWGYGGSGPSQFALAVLMHFLPVEYAIENYQDFKFKIIAGIKKGDFTVDIPLRSIMEYINVNGRG